MKLSLLATAAVLPALGLALAPATDLAFAPEEGSTATRKVESSFEMSLEDFFFSFMGQEIDPAMAGNPEVDFSQDLAIVVTDRFVKVSEGRPLVLERTFDVLDGQQAFGMETDLGESQVVQFELESELEGEAVVFTWDADGEESTAAWAEGSDGGDVLLMGLVEDLDLRGFLPGRAVSEGDSWRIDPASLATLLSPGGNLSLLQDDLGDVEIPPEMMDMMSTVEEKFGVMLEEFFDGASTATFEGMREVDGHELAEVTLDIDVDTTVDLTQMFGEIMDLIADEQMVGDVDIAIDLASIDVEWECEGTMLWDTGAGRHRSLEIGGDLFLAVEFAMSAEKEGEFMEMEATVEMSGSTSFSSAVE